MSKFLFNLVLTILIAFVSCQGNCSDKIPYTFKWNNASNSDTDINITDGYQKLAYHHADSCNTLSAYNIRGEQGYQDLCCYLHVEYQSNYDGDRYDKYGCINVASPYEQYGGSIDNVKTRVEQVKQDFENTKMYGTNESFAKNIHVKILCSSSFLKFSAFALLAIILF